ncbi:glucosyl-3-phosphoglycerate synthase [Corynebacterium guangdongense]|uniref:Glucosyl-3-phosphoglycerate synthase n=1 Tax=Corynebacterium guangdongense TaxID=1783348 RepID=A0ABU1ZVS3_9CORY|nr:glucosyl-3-phosphoglycerate synthase [Corynebacterium guangdongense]MDR7329031.1 glucosyl-3-phosphoglycerate synthase [Corynebacterium guangdongense]WJZ17601.1 Glucosyl-3-phosphoglycerate synthase [Corynebacterium guangdongense]
MRVSVVIPALNEAPTVGAVVRAVAAEHPWEILVIDADSTDATAEEAARAGARVLNWREVLPGTAPRPGKGESLWRGTAAASGDVVVFVDSDLSEVPSGVVGRLAAPFVDERIQLVNADYRRGLDGAPTGGGRVTELTAKPLLRLYFPELARLNQPLAGEYALRRSTALGLPFVAGYGVEVGLLIDTLRAHGPGSIVEVDLGQRHHRNRPLHELGPMADVVAATILHRAGLLPAGAAAPGERAPLSAIL